MTVSLDGAATDFRNEGKQAMRVPQGYAGFIAAPRAAGNRLRWGALALCASVFGMAPIASAEIIQPSAAAFRTPVNLGSAANFAILSKAGISTTGTTAIVGNIGVSPIASTAITGFGLTLDSSRRFSTSSLVTGRVFAANYAAPTPSMLTTAVGDMLIAYSDAAGRKNPDASELGGGNIGGRIIRPGLYKWSSNVIIPTDVTLSGNEYGVWIFQIAGTLNISSGRKVILSGGALPKNIFWQVAGKATLATTAVFHGNILGKTAIVLRTGAKLTGRALAQTAVTLDANAIKRPRF